MPGVACPPVGPVGGGSPPSPGLCAAQTATLPLSGRFAWRSRPDPLPASVCSWGPVRVRARVEAPQARQGFWSPGPPCRDGGQETGGSPTFPRYPWGDLPRSQPPVVSWALAMVPPGLLPSGACTPSAVTAIPLRLSCGPPRYRCRGSMTRPASSLPPASYAHCWAGTWRVLLPGWLGVRQVGLEPEGSHPLGNNNPFHRISPTPTVSGLPWREHALGSARSATPLVVCLLLPNHCGIGRRSETRA